jgi:hypothetical protein
MPVAKDSELATLSRTSSRDFVELAETANPTKCEKGKDKMKQITTAASPRVICGRCLDEWVDPYWRSEWLRNRARDYLDSFWLN